MLTILTKFLPNYCFRINYEYYEYFFQIKIIEYYEYFFQNKL